MGLEYQGKKTREVDGRYEVGLIWKGVTAHLPKYKHVAGRRLELMEKRLENDPQTDMQLKVKFQEATENHLQKGDVLIYCEALELETSCRLRELWEYPGISRVTLLFLR